MTISSLAGGAVAARVQGASALSNASDAAVAVLRTIERQESAEASALVSLIQQSGAEPVKGRNLDVYV
jgi:hypothetical protein